MHSTRVLLHLFVILGVDWWIERISSHIHPEHCVSPHAPTPAPSPRSFHPEAALSAKERRKALLNRQAKTNQEQKQHVSDNIAKQVRSTLQHLLP